jgi:hypothetical protein
MAAHYVVHAHADFIECNCGHLAVTETDFDQHLAHMKQPYYTDANEDRAT